MERADINSSLTDAQLVNLLKEGDHQAFTAIIEKYSALLINYAFRRVAEKELSKDIVQDVFADLWEKRSKNDIHTALSAYLFTATRHRLIDHFRKQKRSEKYIENFAAFLAIQENTTDYLSRHNNLSALIEQEIAALPEKMRQVFELSRKNDLNRKEIAQKLDIPENTVKTNMQRALKLLKRKLDLLPLLLF